MAEGYKYGARTDSVLKTHSNLVAYCDMSSYEQDYDRASAVKVITTLLDLNYTINKVNYVRVYSLRFHWLIFECIIIGCAGFNSRGQ